MCSAAGLFSVCAKDFVREDVDLVRWTKGLGGPAVEWLPANALNPPDRPVNCRNICWWNAQVVVEFAMNDPTVTNFFDSPERMAFERLLRKLLEFPHRCAPQLAATPRQLASSLVPGRNLSVGWAHLQASRCAAQPLCLHHCRGAGKWHRRRLPSNSGE
jgi:hypothetical protein